MNNTSHQIKRSEQGPESGNVLWFILIAIVLLGALTLLLSRSGSSVDQSGDYEQQSIKATQLMRYTSGIEKAVEKLKLVHECSENDINFENSTEAGYTNANSPSDQSCHVFETEGAGLEWRVLTPESLAMSGNDDMMFTTEAAISSIGGGGAELLAFIPVSQSLCTHINNRFGISNTVADITSDIDFPAKFTGSFASNFDLGNGAGEAPGMAGEPTGCIIDDNGDYVFYHAIIER